MFVDELTHTSKHCLSWHATHTDHISHASQASHKPSKSLMSTIWSTHLGATEPLRYWDLISSAVLTPGGRPAWAWLLDMLAKSWARMGSWEVLGSCVGPAGGAGGPLSPYTPLRRAALWGSMETEGGGLGGLLGSYAPQQGRPLGVYGDGVGG